MMNLLLPCRFNFFLSAPRGSVVSFAPPLNKIYGVPKICSLVPPRRYFAAAQSQSQKIIFSMRDVTKLVSGNRVIIKDGNLSFFEGAKIGVLGVNGSGKSTLLKIVAGEDTDFDGQVTAAKGIKVGYLHQEPQLDPEKDVKGNVLDGVEEKTQILIRYEEVIEELKSTELNPRQKERLQREHERLLAQIDKQKLRELSWKIDRAIDALRCPAGDSPVEHLSGGEKRRVALCRLLISQPDMLLLDEPTNHLDAESVAWLERHLAEYKGTILAVTHDRYFLDNVANWILEVDRGQLIPCKGNYSAWLQHKQKRTALEKRKDLLLQKRMQEELDWIRQPPKAKSKKNKSRIERYDEMVEQAAKYESYEPGTIAIPPGPRLGYHVIAVNNLTHTFDGKLLFQDLTFEIPRGAIVGIIGPNGSGKTTLFRIITGELAPEKGSVRIGPTVKMGFVSQSRDELNPDNTIYQEVSEGQDSIDMGNGNIINMRAYLGAFHFMNQQQEKLVGGLSGGERNRVYLAKMIKRGSNVLLLDEPTNDLDVDVLRNLENSLTTFQGTAVVISHDRYFLDRICTTIIAFESDSNVVYFPGNYSEYEEDRMERLGNKFDPKRIKYKKLHVV